MRQLHLLHYDSSALIHCLVAHLHISIVSDSTDGGAKDRIRRFIHCFLSAFQPTSPTTTSFRCRAMTSLGRELINGTSMYSQVLNEASNHHLVSSGLKSLRLAKELKEGLYDDPIDYMEVYNDLSTLI